MTPAERRALIDKPFPMTRIVASTQRYAPGYRARPVRSMSRDLKMTILPRPWIHTGNLHPTLSSDPDDDVMVRQMVKESYAAFD